MKYLFGCENDKGETYLQTNADVSQKNPSKSAYYDIKDENLLNFWLEGEGHKYLVDLRDGHFEIDGLKFRLHDEDLKDFKLIYYRTHTIDFAGLVETNHDVEFCFGWQTNKDGKNYKQIMRIK